MQDGCWFTIALNRDLATDHCLFVIGYAVAVSLLSLPLRYFLEVARTGSVNQAAQRLHVAASAVSRQLGKLEDSLGVVLFERQARGMTLTEAGTRKRLAAYVVHSPADVPGIASLGPDPLSDDFTREALALVVDTSIGGRRHRQRSIHGSATCPRDHGEGHRDDQPRHPRMDAG